MELQGKEMVKHIAVIKFKEGVQTHEIEEFIKACANLVHLIPPLKSFHWGTDLGVSKLDQGFTHIFELIFESAQGVAEYMVHPAHTQVYDAYIHHVNKFLIIDYTPLTL